MFMSGFFFRTLTWQKYETLPIILWYCINMLGTIKSHFNTSWKKINKLKWNQKISSDLSPPRLIWYRVFFFFKHTDSSLVMPFYGETMFLDGRGLSTVTVVVVEDKMAISPVRIIKKCREHFSNVQRHAESKVTEQLAVNIISRHWALVKQQRANDCSNK